MAGVSVLLALLSAFLSGPLSDIRRLDQWHHETQQNRFTDHDGQSLHRELQEKFTLTQEQLNKLWDRMRDVEDEDFKRGEADSLRYELMEEIRWLRERSLMHCPLDSCPKNK